ncbi:MAG: cellulase N-terminal Ig-like domain-containing protein, partial [Spirochaetota bacterium]
MSILLTVLSCASTENNHHDASGMRIHVNQVGYYTDAPKLFTVVNTSADSFTIQDEHGTTVHTGPLSDNGYYDASGEHVKTGDFSALQTPGTYIIRVGTAAAPHPCIIGSNIYKGALYGTVRSYYYQRCSMQLDEAYAGRWARPAG